MSLLRTYTSGIWNTVGSALEMRTKSRFMGDLWHLKLTDGDSICSLLNFPHVELHKQVIVIVHGLAGSALEPTSVSVAKKFLSEGYPVIRVNLRGAGQGAGLSKNIYHAAKDDDIEYIVQEVSKKFPEYKITLVCMSLSANLMFRYLASKNSLLLKNAIALSPVVDVASASRSVSNAYWGTINKSVLRTLKKYFYKRSKNYPQLRSPDWSLINTLYDLDNLFVCHELGLKNAKEYYEYSSSVSLLAKANVPWKIVLALDDPISISEKVIFKKFKANSLLFPQGGHLYFKKLGGQGELAFRALSLLEKG